MPNRTVRAAATGLPRAKKQHLRYSFDPTHLPLTYCMTCEGNCPEPAIPDGSSLMFTTEDQPKAGDLVGIYRRPEAVKEGQHQALVKRLLTTEPVPCFSPEWVGVQMAYIAEMDNPPARLLFRVGDLQAIHKCLGVTPKSMKRYRMSDAELEADFQARRVAAGRVGAGAPLKARITASGAAKLPKAASLPVFDTLPLWHALVPVMGNSAGPHFRASEFAVVDTTDRHPMDGALFAMAGRLGGGRIDTKPTPPRIVEMNAVGGPLNRGLWSFRAPCARGELTDLHSGSFAAGRIFDFLSDGPFTTPTIADMTCGRVVGVYGPTLLVGGPR